MKTIDVFITAKVSFSVPDTWDYPDVEEEAKRYINTHLELNNDCYWEPEMFSIQDVELRQFAEYSPYREE